MVERRMLNSRSAPASELVQKSAIAENETQPVEPVDPVEPDIPEPRYYKDGGRRASRYAKPKCFF